jgi:hypothetical protein
MIAIPRWFFAVSGLTLVAVGVGLILTRPQPKHERGLNRIINFGHLWASSCVLAGLFVLLCALGVIPWPPRR